MSRLLLPVALAAALSPAAAAAVDWTVTANGSTGLQFDPEGDGLSASASAGLGVRARTKTTDWNFNSGLSVSANKNGFSVPLPGLSASVSHREPRTTYRASMSFQPALARSSFFRPLSPFDSGDDSDDADSLPGVLVDGVEVEAVRLPLSLNFGLTHTPTPRDTLSLGGFFSLVEYTKSSPALATSRSWGLNGGWRRAVRNDLGLGFSASAREAHTFGQTETASRTFSLSGDADWQVNRRFSVSGSLGPSLVQVLKGPNEGDSTVSLNGGLRFRYQPRPDLSFSGGISQGFEQDENGAFKNRLSADLGGSYSINARESVRLGGAIGLTNPAFGGGDSTLTASLSPGYSWRITRNLSLGANYSLRYSDDDRGFTHSAGLNLSFNRVLLP